MTAQCVFCGHTTGLRAIAAVILTGNGTRPEGGIVCRTCAALPAEEQERRRRLVGWPRAVH
jgi:hypothetical protein